MKTIFRVSVIFGLCVGFVCAIVSPAAAADLRSKSLDSATATDLSLSLFRDNYDVWAGEVMERLLVETAGQIAPLQNKIAAADDSRKLLERKIRSRLIELYKAKVVDETSVRAALILAKNSAPAERKDYLKNAVRMAQFVAPGSVATLRVSLLYLATLLQEKSFTEAEDFSEKVLQISAQTSLADESEVCLAMVLSADSFFQNSSYDRAEKTYGQAYECSLKKPVKKDSHFLSQIQIRRAWSSFRLLKYADTLERLEQLLAVADWQRYEMSAALKSDLAVTVGVSLSEVGANSPPTVWIRRSGSESWVADGLVRAIKYFVQKEQFKTAVRWTEQLESTLGKSRFALEFFVHGTAALEGEGSIEAMHEFRSRAVASLHPRGTLARTIASIPAEDLRRRSFASDWARSVISYRLQQDAGTLGVSRLNNLFVVAESLYEDRAEACTDSEAFISAHRIFASARQDVLAEKVFDWFKDCTNVNTRRAEIELLRLEMFRAAALRAVRDESSWRILVNHAEDVLGRFRSDVAIRRIALDILNDGLELTRYKDAERIFLLLLVTANFSGEEAQFTWDGLISAAIRLIVLPQVSPQLDAAVWSMLDTVSAKLTPVDSNRRRLEFSLAFYASRVSLELRHQGRLGESVESLSDHAARFSNESEAGANLRFRAAELSCRLALESECLLLTGQFIQSGIYPSHDLAVIHHLRGSALIRAGRYLSAAETFLSGAGHAADSGRLDLILLLKNGVIRAGEIFADLRLWQETLDARTALLKLADVSGNRTAVHGALLRWSLQAAQSQAYDKSAALASGLQNFIDLRGPSGRRGLRAGDGLPLVHRFVSLVPSVFSSGLPAAEFQELLFEALRQTADLKGVLIRNDVRMNQLALNLISVASQKWHSELKRNAELISVQKGFSGVESALPVVRRSFDALTQGCRLSKSADAFLGLNSSDCLTGVSGVFRGVTERLRETALRQSRVDIRRLRKFDSDWNTLRSKVLAQGRRGHSRSSDSEDVFDIFAERRLNLWGQSGNFTGRQESQR